MFIVICKGGEGGGGRSFKGPRQKYRPTYIRTTTMAAAAAASVADTVAVSHAFSSAPDSCYYPRILVGISTLDRLPPEYSNSKSTF